MKKYYLILITIVAVGYLFSVAPVLSNSSVTPGSGQVVIGYDLVADGNCEIVIIASINNGTTYDIYPATLSGDIGRSVAPGTGKEIIWNPGADGLEVGEHYKVKIIARDNPVDNAQQFESFIKIDGGTFNNGTANVTISDFYISKYEVTQAEFEAVMGTNPSHYSGLDNPVDQATWFNAVKYCNLRSMQEGLIPCYNYNEEGTDPNVWSSGWDSDANHESFSCNFSASGYRLPTEMEWMFAAKGGTQQPETEYNQYSGTDLISELPGYAWYNENSATTTYPVGTKLPNQLGLYDMSGNVWEWCWDIYWWYDSSPETDPTGPSAGDLRMFRGGSWNYTSSECMVASRNYTNPSYIYTFLGFRLARRSE